MSDEGEDEVGDEVGGAIRGRRAGDIGRVEAFSDGVLAIVITIMVLELKPPEAAGLRHLGALWPTFLAYALSYAYVGIYWVNHHRLCGHARRVSNALVWLNLLLLFALSLVPFTTAYMGQQHFSRDAVLVYLASLLLPAIGYVPLQLVVRATGARDGAALAYHRRSIRKGWAALAIYAAGLPLALVSPWAGIACAAAVAILWFLPDSPLDALFGAG